MEEYLKCFLHFQYSEMVAEFPACEILSHWKTAGSIRSLMDQIKELESLRPIIAQCMHRKAEAETELQLLVRESLPDSGLH